MKQFDCVSHFNPTWITLTAFLTAAAADQVVGLHLYVHRHSQYYILHFMLMSQIKEKEDFEIEITTFYLLKLQNNTLMMFELEREFVDAEIQRSVSITL